jgi:uncharacterized protein (TIGR03437 family)
MDWTPPATDVGDIVFYAAGNAANGDGTNAGDHVYTTVRRVSPPCTLTQKPVLTSMLNSASFRPAWNVGALATVFGSNFAPAGARRALAEGDIVNQKAPRSLGCVAVNINGQAAPIVYVQGDQINFQVPTTAGVGPATVQVVANPGAPNELRSDPLTVTTQQTYAPAIFTLDGKNAAAFLGDKVVADPSVISGGVPAKPGDVITLYATGLGGTDPAVSPGDIAQDLGYITAPWAISIGGVSLTVADVTYIGLAPRYICGLQQVNVRVPASVPDGNAAIVLTVGGIASPAGVTIPVKR